MQFPLAPAHEDIPPAGLKLRDSCNRCAVSKIKCSKEKPACARCAKQDKVCEYSATKRAGRKRGSRRRNPVPSPTTQDLPTAAPSTCPTFLDDPETIPLSPRPPFESYPDLFPGIFSIGDDPLIATPITLDTFSFPFDSFSASPISLPTLDVSDGDHRPDSTPLNHLNHPGDRTDVARATALLASDHASASSMDPAAGPQRPPDEPSSGPICGFIRALGLLNNGLSSPAWPTSHHPGLDPRPSSRSIMAENEQTVRAISEMLHCQCFEDGYLLAILSMMILKILSSYATLLRQTPGPDGDGPSWDHSTPPPGEQGAGVDGEDHCRTIAQQILGQLHRVQRLVSILSQRFNIPGGRARTPDSTAGPDLLSSIETLFPVPGSMLEQMEGLLRKRLRTLSAEIVDILR